jgi:hypothetical protein
MSRIIPFNPTRVEQWHCIRVGTRQVSKRGYLNVAVMVTHKLMLANKRLVSIEREDPHLQMPDRKVMKNGKQSVEGPYAVMRDKRINVELTDENEVKLNDIKNKFSTFLNTDAKALSFCIRTLAKYIKEYDPDVLSQWDEMKPQKPRTSNKDNVSVTLRISSDVYLKYKLQSQSLNKTTNLLMAQVLESWLDEKQE